MRVLRHFLFVLLLMTAGNGLMQAQTTTDSLQISLLTASPGTEVYERFGHTALRVHDLKGPVDIVFNYGLFSFNAPNFLYRFVKGETDYQLGITDFPSFVLEYNIRGSKVTEQILNLPAHDTKKLFDLLLENYQPENRVYRYNFFFDNCSTRPRQMIERSAESAVLYQQPAADSLPTFREMVYEKTNPTSWLSFGIDLTLGAPADREATYLETTFLPERLMEAFQNARLSDGSPLIKNTVVVVEEEPREPTKSHWINSPLTVCWVLFAVFMGMAAVEWYRKKIFRCVDTMLFSVAGIAGCILYFLNFFSLHPAVDHNYNCIWLQPLQLFAAIGVWVKSAKTVLYYYHFVNFVALLILLIGYGLIPQHFNPAFFPLIGILMSRSALHILLRLKKNHR